MALAACGAQATGTEPAATDETDNLAERAIELALTTTAYAIDSSQSEARFVIDEVLAGDNNTVVGRTRAIEGLITLDQENPAELIVGTIRVDLATLRTDSDRRDTAIRRFVLQTDQTENQFAVFQTSQIVGLPQGVDPDVSYPLILSGALTVHGVTLPTAFEGDAMLTSGGRLQGSFSTTVLRQDFNLSIPNVPLVANVDEQVILELDFVAVVS
jgi:polyisoprenoid-binding protein YceI